MSPRKEQLIDQLFTLGNLYEDFVLAQNYSFAIVRQKYPKLSDDQYHSLVSRFGGQWYIDQVKGVYDQYFSEQEVQEIIRFWSSDTGRKLVQGGFSHAIKAFHANWAIAVENACMLTGSKEE